MRQTASSAEPSAFRPASEEGLQSLFWARKEQFGPLAPGQNVYNLAHTPARNPSTGRKVALYAILRLSAIQYPR